MFKNKHFILALLIAPILSIIAYFGTDMALSEKPHAAKEGKLTSSRVSPTVVTPVAYVTWKMAILKLSSVLKTDKR